MAVAVAQEVDAVLPDQRVLARAGVVRRQGRRLGGAESIRPEVLGRSAFVPLGVAALEGEAREIERSSRGVERTVGRLAEGQERFGIGGRVENDELGIGQGRILLCGVEDLAVRRPAGDGPALAREGAAHGQSAGEGHRIDLGRALVLGGEGQRLPVGRDGRIGFDARVRGQTAGQAAADVDRPQVAFRDEDDGVAVDGREPVVAGPARGQPGCRGRRGGAGLDGNRETQQNGNEREGSFHGLLLRGEIRMAVFYSKIDTQGNDFGCRQDTESRMIGPGTGWGTKDPPLSKTNRGPGRVLSSVSEKGAR